MRNRDVVKLAMPLGVLFLSLWLPKYAIGQSLPTNEPAPAPAPAPGKSNKNTTVSYQAVDASTLRVFAIGSVGTSTFTFNDGSPSITVATPQSGHGTGFMVGSDGLVLTAQHVIDGATHVAIRLPGQQGFVAARVVVTSKESDIAVLSIESNLAAIALSKENTPLPVRQTVYALGYPIDPSRTQAQSSRGIVSGALDDGTVQLDISVNPGNSGGPLVDEQHQVVGMVVARGDVESGVQGLGFAVPLWKLKRALVEARKRIQAGRIKALAENEKESAAVVDKLILHGALHVLKGRDDLNTTVDQKILEENLDSFIDSIKNPELLVFMAGNLWNAQLVLRHGHVDTINGKKLAAHNRRALADRLWARVQTLVKRATKLDSKIAKRSSFVSFVLSGQNQGKQSRTPSTYIREQPPSKSRFPTGQTMVSMRSDLFLVTDSEPVPLGAGLGATFLLKYELKKNVEGRTDILIGIGATIGAGKDSEIFYDINSDVRSQEHITRQTTYAAEFGLGHMIGAPPLHIFLEAAWSPGLIVRKQTKNIGYHFSANRPDTTETTTSESFAPLQFRLTAGLIRHSYVELFGTLRFQSSEIGGEALWIGAGAGVTF